MPPKKSEIQINFEYYVALINDKNANTPLGAKGPTDSEKLKFYGLYKQGTQGKCTTDQPWAIQVIERAKWDAWNSLGNMSKDTAMMKYCEHYINLCNKYEK